MAKCPNCGYHLRFIDWKPNCPNCGVNLNYFGLEEKLQDEADKAEVEHAKVQKRIDRLKTAFVGSPLTIARIFLSVIPIGMVMLPLCTIKYSGPLISETVTKLNIIGVYNALSSLDFDILTTLMGSKLVGTGFLGYGVSLISIFASLVMVLVSLIALCAAMGKKGNIRNIFNNSLAIIFAAVSAVFFSIFSKNINSVFPEFYDGSLSIGIYLYIASLVVLLALNIYLTVNKVQVKYKQCYVGGIPVEEYLQELENGTSIDELHERMNKILAEKEAERVKEAEKKAAERKAKEEEEMARKAGKYLEKLKEEEAEAAKEAEEKAEEAAEEIADAAEDVESEAEEIAEEVEAETETEAAIEKAEAEEEKPEE